MVKDKDLYVLLLIISVSRHTVSHTMMLCGLFLSLLVSVQSFQTDEKESSSCPDHWVDATLTGMGCLLFNSTTAYTWEEANNYCQRDENALLVEIWTSLQLDFIRTELTLLMDHESARDWWTSATDLAREGEWYWASSGAPVGDFVWHNNEPNGGTNENCMMLFNGYDFLGDSYDCNYTDRFYPICQIK